MPCATIALLSLYLSFLCFGLLVWTRSRPCGLCHCLHTLAHIKGFGSPISHVYACYLPCFMLVLASLVLGLATFDAFSGSWCYGYIWRPWGLVWMQPFGRHLCDVGCFMHISPFSALCDDMLTMLVCATRWLSMHLYTLAYMFMHESCLLVCRPCFNTMKS